MRLHLLCALPLLAGPLAAQQRAIAPAPSALFRAATLPPVSADSVTPYSGLSTFEGSLIGGLGGFLTGLALAQIVEAQSPCGCEDPGLDRTVSYGLSGLLIGGILGGLLARD